MLSDDVLPQPYRFINKLVNRCIDDAFENIRRKQLSENAHRRFAPPRSLHVHSTADVPVLATAADMPVSNAPGPVPLKPSEPSAVHHGSTSLVFGFRTGRAVVHASDSGECLGLFTVSANEPVVAVTAADRHCVFAAATPSAVTLFYALNEELTKATAPPSLQELPAAAESTTNPPPPGRGAESTAPGSRQESRAQTPGVEVTLPPTNTLAVWCTVTAELVAGLGVHTIAHLTLSDDCTHLAIAFATSPAEVVCVKLPDPRAVLRGDIHNPPSSQLSTPRAAARPVTNATDGAPTVVFTTSPPKIACPAPPPSARRASIVADQAALRQGIVCEFICEDDAVAHLGKRSQPTAAVKSSPATARFLCVAWTGTNCFSTYSLVTLGAAQPPPPPAVAPPTVVTMAPVDMLAPSPTAGKAAKGAASASASKAAAGADGAADGTQAGGANTFAAVAVGPTTYTPGIPFTPVDDKFNGERHRLLPHYITCAALCRATGRHDLFALGLCDGMVFVWSAIRGYFVHSFNDAPHRLRQCPVNPMIATNIAFYRGTHLVVGHSLPMGAVAKHGTDHSRVTVYSLEDGTQTCSVDFVPQLSWVACARDLPVMFFATGGKLFAADVLSGSLVAEIAVPALAASNRITRTRDLNIVLEHCGNVHIERPGIVGSSGLAMGAAAANEGGESRYRVYYVDAARIVFDAYPLIDRYCQHVTVEQLAFVLSKIPDAADRHNEAIVGAIQPPGTIHHQQQNRRSIASTHGGRAPSAASISRTAAAAASARADAATPAVSVRPPLAGTAKGATLRSMSRATTAETGASQRAAAAANSAAQHAGVPHTTEQHAQRVIDARVASRASREQRFKSLWQSIQQ
jgi:hypothetical protein